MKIILRKSWDEIRHKWGYASYKKDLFGWRSLITIGDTEEECIARTKELLFNKAEEKTISLK